ncbi:PREDICTED: uncharacterized protein LOC107067792 isoform X2 [Polistes dominula]|uniref:Uncharacterized protein LOC107067792 isoform X2 n=1 Tax=Polistes dominula TaxID=743375 RepID=A0ABM1IFW7_POLDO|nr:PREDICTED: uncharacterized protein LOC107067792 isoform X2 [Polistes dominula]
MNSKEDGKMQGKSETRLDGGLQKNDNQTTEQGNKLSKATKIQNKMSDEQLKLNNNVSESDAKSVLPSKSSMMVSNGARSMEATTSDCSHSLEQVTISDTPNASSSSTFVNTTSVISHNANTNSASQLKHKTVVNANTLNLPKPQMHLNLSSGQLNCHLTNTVTPVSYSSINASNTNAYSNTSISNSSTVSQHLSGNRLNDDTDMKNNVDYASEIEKCPSKVSCSSDSSPEGSTSQGTCFLRPNINGNREVAGPSGLQRYFQKDIIDRRDSSSGNEGDMSDGEDYCIYTYKGNDNIVNLDQKEEVNRVQVAEHEVGQCHSGRSSPEMDFLEMDFDPGPSCEQDTGDSDLASINEDIQNITLDNAEADPVLNDLSSGKVVSRQGIATVPQHNPQTGQNVSHIVTQQCSNNRPISEQSSKQTYSSPWMPSTSSGSGCHSNLHGKTESIGFHRNLGCPLRESYGYHNTSGDLISPGDNRDSDSELWTETSTVSTPGNSNLNSRKVNLSSTLYHRMMAKKLMLNKQTPFNQSGDSNLENELSNEQIDGLPPVKKVMLWNEQEATTNQVTQIATSACGATSAINALLALKVSFSAEVLVKAVGTRLRDPGSPLPQYLMSRSLAGSTHKDIARGISLSTSGAVITKFFSFYPERKVSLSHWLHYWISKGAAPIATLNLQHCGEGTDIPDAWHHQMIFGVGQAGIYLTNPLQCLPEQLVWHQLVSPSVLLVRRADVLARWNANTDLTLLAKMDQKWRKLNVLGQVVNMIREAMNQRQQPNVTTIGTTHIRIPASYQAGITLVMCADSADATELLHAEQLPLL